MQNLVQMTPRARLRTSALIASIGMSLKVMDSVGTNILTITSTKHLQNPGIVLLWTCWSLLFSVPLPLLFFMMYRKDPWLALMRNSRILILIATTIQAVYYSAPTAYSTLLLLYRRWIEIQTLAGQTLAEKIYADLSGPVISQLVGSFATLSYNLTFLLLLVALCNYKTSQESGGPTDRMLLSLALIVVAIMSAELVLVAGQAVYAIVTFAIRPPSTWDMLTVKVPSLPEYIGRTVLSRLGAVVYFLTAFVIYKCLPKPIERANEA